MYFNSSRQLISVPAKESLDASVILGVTIRRICDCCRCVKPCVYMRPRYLMYTVTKETRRSTTGRFRLCSCHWGPNTPLCPHLLPIPHPRDPCLAHLALELEDAVHEGLAGGGAAGDVDVDGDDAVAAADDAVAVVVVAAAVGAAAHTDHPARLRHLVVHLPQRRRHLVRQRARHDHHVRLSGRSAEDDSEPVLVVSRRGQVHHLDGAAGQPEGHGP